MHRVAGFVGQREDVVEHVRLVVHEDVRPAVVEPLLNAPLRLPWFG